MIRRLSILTILLLLVSTRGASAAGRESLQLLGSAWPDGPATRIDDVGRGIGVVFSPDLSVTGNCRFYEALGFACFQDADWGHVLDAIHRHNVLYPQRRIYTLVLETHGTNGNGLKLQTSYSPTAERSYIAVGALQERLEPDGIYYIIISACNSGRLLRPYIRNELDVWNGDKLFLPATCGIVNASANFDGTKSAVTIITPESSHIETTLVGSMKELAPEARRRILASARALHITPPVQFAVSDIMMQMLTRDPRLQLASNHYVDEMSPVMQPADRSEELYRRFLTYLNAVAQRETVTARIARQPKWAPRSIVR
jgi:hypothetical protein